MRHKIILLILLMTMPLIAWAENASNVRVRQRNKDIIIIYDLSKKSNVQVLMANDKIPDFVPLSAVEGAVGKNILAGKNLEIVWHPLQENDNFVAQNVRFKVVALGAYEQYALPKTRDKIPMGGKTNIETFITIDAGFAFSKEISAGLMFGETYSGIGWYISGRTNLNFKGSDDGMVIDKNQTIDGINPGFTGRKQSSIMVANVGLVMDFLEFGGGSPRNRFNTIGMYVGAGYGWHRRLWQTASGQWAEYGPGSHKGVSVNAGVIGSVYGFTIKAGVNTIQFKYFEVEAGIGWMF